MPIKTVTVYSSMATNLPPEYYTAARELGAALGDAKINVVYGGSNRGIMGTIADAVLERGGHVTGIFPNVPKLMPTKHTGLSDTVLVNEMHERKREMCQRADAFIVMPGGYGTLDEVFEVLTLRKLELHTKHVFFFNQNGYWQPMMTMLAHFISLRTMNPDHLSYFSFAQSVPELMAMLEQPPQPE